MNKMVNKNVGAGCDLLTSEIKICTPSFELIP